MRLYPAEGYSHEQDDYGLFRKGCCRIWAASDLTGESSLFFLKMNFSKLSEA